MIATLHDDRLPEGYNTLNPFVLVKGPGGADGFIGFLRDVFGGVERAGVRTPDRDGSILHAEVRMGNSSVLIADSKPGWPSTPAFQQIYVEDIPTVLERAEAAGAEIVTPRSPFYNGVDIARILDPWGNLWWIYEPAAEEQGSEPAAAAASTSASASAAEAEAASADTSWQDREPSIVYTTLMAVMARLGESPAARVGSRLAHPALDVRHDIFTITRRHGVPPASVFEAFSDEQTRRRWFRLPGAGAVYRHEFRVGSGEDAHSTFPIPDFAPEQLRYRSRYLDISTDRRIVFVYESIVDDGLRWTSLVTVLIDDDGDGGSVLTWTEQVAFLTRTGDGSADLPHLRGGTALRLNGLAAALEPAP